MEKNKTKNMEWSEQDISRLPLNALLVIDAFLKKGKPTLKNSEIEEALDGKIKGKSLGATLAIFSKYKGKEPLLNHVLRISVGNGLWEINNKYIPMLKKHMEKISKYL